MFIKLLLLEKSQDSKIVPFKAVAVGCNSFLHYLLTHFKTFLDVFGSTVYVLSYTCLYVFHVVKMGSSHGTFTFGKRKVTSARSFDLLMDILMVFLTKSQN
jgi:hypothetical protein